VIEVESPVKSDEGDLQGTAFHVKLPVLTKEESPVIEK
jgi:hypothetical protein